MTKLQWAGPFSTGVFMGFTHVFSGPGSACKGKQNLGPETLPYGMAASFPGAAVHLAVCWWPSLPWSPALSMGSAALRPPGLRPFTLPVSAPHWSLISWWGRSKSHRSNEHHAEVVREKPSLPVETRAHGESVYSLAASLLDPGLEMPGYFSLWPSALLLWVLTHSCASCLGLRSAPSWARAGKSFCCSALGASLPGGVFSQLCSCFCYQLFLW